jgi:hypothetical protein
MTLVYGEAKGFRRDFEQAIRLDAKSGGSALLI